MKTPPLASRSLPNLGNVVAPRPLLLLLAGALAAGACATPAAPPAAAPSATPSARSVSTAAAPILTLASAEAVGMDAAALESAVGLFREAVEADDLRGAVLLVARRGQVVLHETLGWRDRENGLPMEHNTLFRMASNTKPVVATAALLLEQDGKLSMEDPVSKYIPAFAAGDLAKITVHQLATHTSGLPRSPIFLRGVSEDSDLLREAGRFANSLKLQREPGSEYEYSNAAYNILGGVIEAASGRPLADFLRERIYEPLGMRESSNHESTANQSRMAKIYRRNSGQWTAAWSPGDRPDYPIVRASGGMISTAWEYAIFLQTWLNGGRYGGVRLLSEASVVRATSPLVRAGNAGYGYGWQVARDGVYGHGGSDGTQAWVDPANELIVIVFTQSPSGGRNPRAEFLQLVRSAIRPGS